MVTNNGNPQYQVSTFVESELPLSIGTPEDTHLGRNDAPILAMGNRALYARSKEPGANNTSSSCISVSLIRRPVWC